MGYALGDEVYVCVSGTSVPLHTSFFEPSIDGKWYPAVIHGLSSFVEPSNVCGYSPLDVIFRVVTAHGKDFEFVGAAQWMFQAQQGTCMKYL